MRVLCLMVYEEIWHRSLKNISSLKLTKLILTQQYSSCRKVHLQIWQITHKTSAKISKNVYCLFAATLFLPCHILRWKTWKTSSQKWKTAVNLTSSARTEGTEATCLILSIHFRCVSRQGEHTFFGCFSIITITCVI